MKVGIAAAGTGGHVYPALAVAEELTERGVERGDIVFFGGDRIEATVVPEAGYPFVGVDIHGLRREISMDNVALFGKTLRARRRIASEVVGRQLKVMVVFGGYVAGPAALAASKAHIPLIVHEANAVPGLANRMVARNASKIFVAFAPATQRFPEAHVIGSPLRRSLSTFDRSAARAPARAAYGIAGDETVLGVVGGSQGAQFLNEVAGHLAADPTRNFSIVHLTGSVHHEAIAAQAANHERWITVPYEENMVDLYAASDLVLSRGGAMTVSELQATRTPAVIVPLPAGRGYQALNASDLVASGGAVVVEQDSGEAVARRVMDLIADREALARMAAPRTGTDHRAAAAIMADAIMEYADA